MNGRGIRGTLLLVALGLSLVVLIPGGLFVHHQLRRAVAARIERDTERALGAARILLEASGASSAAEIDRLAGRLADELRVRITVIAASGNLLGDSAVPLEGLPAMTGHLDRPEVRAARQTGRGRAERRSGSVDLLYMAAPFDRGDVAGVVRVARSTGELRAALAQLRRLLFIAGLLAIGGSVILAAAAAQLVSRTMRELVDSARGIAEVGSAEVGSAPAALAGSLKRMSLEIEQTVADRAAERARSAAVLEGMSEGVVAVNSEGQVTLINRAAQTLLGAGADAIGRSLLEVVRVPALDELVAGVESGRSVEFELPATRRRVLAQHAPQEAGGSVLVLHDVTELHRLETIRRDFVANVSHELRTPVSVISANAETLVSGALEDRQTAPRLVEAIHRNALRLTDLIDGLLDLSRLEAGRYEIATEDVALAAAARRAVDAVERLAERRHTAIAALVPDSLQAIADPRPLHQILVNLLENAIKHTPDGTGVKVTGRARGDRVRLEVADDGPGIPPGQAERIFERFYRIDPGRSREMGGTGLGLSIVKHLVDAMGGTVGVRDNRPRGAVFWVDLPGPEDRKA